MKRVHTLFLFGALALLAQGALAMKVPASADYSVEQLSESECRLQLLDVTQSATIPVLLESSGSSLSARTADGREFHPQLSELGRLRDTRRLGMNVSADLLREGLVLRETGSLPPLRVTDSAMSSVDADDWAPFAFLRFDVAEDGMYRINGEWLSDSLLEMPDEILSDPRYWTLVHNDQPVPVWISGEEDGVFDAEDALVFWAEFTQVIMEDRGPDTWHDPWTNLETFFLCYRPGFRGVRMAQESGELVSTNPDEYVTPASFPETRHFEEDTYVSRLTRVFGDTQPDNESWGSGIFAGELRNFDFETPGLDRSSSLSPTLRVCMRGFSATSSTSTDEIIQRVQLYVNNLGGEGMEIGASGDWGNQELRIVEFSEEVFEDHSALNSLDNVLRVACLDQAPADERSAVLMNWFELEYQRNYEAENGQLVFSARPELADQLIYFDVTGFTEERVDLYKLGSSKFRNHFLRRDDSGWRLRFQDVFRRDTRYVALSPGAYKQPLRVRPAEYHNLAGASTGASYLIVLCDTLYQAGGNEVLQPLVEHLEQTHGDVMLLSDRWIYDEFSAGRFRPHAIRRLLQTAWLRWNQVPEYLLLIGGGGLQQRFSVEQQLPALPIYYSQMRGWGAASIDDWYTRTTDGRWLGTIAARWPASSLDDLQNMVDKVRAYDSRSPDVWNNNLLLVAGAKARDEGAFQVLMEELIRYHLPQHLFVRRIEAGETGERYIGGRQELLDLLAQGQVLVNYHGHGGSDVWYDNDLLRGEDVPLMENEDRLPFVTNVTCFIVSPEPEETLGRNLLNTGQMGAIGVMGSTAVTFQEAGSELGSYFYEYITNNPELSVGEALRLAKERMFLLYVHGSSEEQTAAEAATDMMAILGLPSQKLKLSHASENLIALQPPVLQQGADFVIQGPAVIQNADLVAELYSERSDPHQTGIDFINDVYQVRGSAQAGEPWSLTAQTPSELYRGGQPATARVALVTAEGVEATSADFFFADSLESLQLWDAAFDPETPRAGDTAAFRVRAAAPAAIDSLIMLHTLYHTSGDSTQTHTRLELIQISPLDATLYGSEAVIGPLQEGDLLRLDLLTYWGDEENQGVPIYLPIEQPMASLQLTQLGYGRDFDGALALQIDNVGDLACAEGEAQLVIQNQAGDTLQVENLPAVAAAERVNWPLMLHAGLLGDTLTYTLQPASLLNELQGASPPLPLNEIYLSIQDTLLNTARAVTQNVSLEGYTQPGALLAVRLVDPEELSEHQPGLQHLGTACAWEWLSGEEEYVYGRLRLDNLDSLSLANAELLSLSSRADFLVRHLPGSYDLVSIDEGLEYRFMLGGGGVGAGWFLDEQAPTVEMQIENQIYSPGGFVPREPAFSFLLSDRNGVDEGNELSFLFDGVELEESAFSLQEDKDPGQLVLRVTPDTYGADTDSLHTLAFSCADAAGNRSESSYQFYLSDDFRLEYIGNYPNPFQRETRFVFKLTGIAESVRIEIFTVSGRPIRTLRLDGPVIDYTELMWDGRDRHGDLVANGVYYYRFVADRSQGQIEEIGKMAKLK